MTSKHAHGLGLAVGTILWLALTGWVLTTAPARDARSSPRRGRGEGPSQEPPQPRTVWNRLTAQVPSLFLRRPGELDRKPVRQAIEQLGAAAWHQAGRRGKGVKIAVLDSGFKGYRAALGRVLPSRISVRSFRQDGQLEARESQHGILCGEVIHHLAPEAELLFANWEPEQPAAFLEAVAWARREGARIISCSIIMPSWSDGEGGGSAHQTLRAVLGPGDGRDDGLFFASAGNTAQRHWGGAFRRGKEGWHQWVTGRTDNVVRPYSHERVSVEMTGGAGLELVVVDLTRSREVGRSASLPADGCASAVVRFEPAGGHRYGVRVRAVTSNPTGRFHLTVLGGRLQYATPLGSIPFPGDGPEVIAVGAVDGRGRRCSYSSCGPCGGTAKPDLVAPVPFPSLWRVEQPFAGTSAAAPQAAALAALVWSAHPEWTATQVRRALNGAAAKGQAGHSPETGHGKIRLP